jgi:peptide/nickel transport system permease protein
MYIEAVRLLDYPVILALVMLTGMFVIMGNLLADLLYGLVDPRIKY